MPELAPVTKATFSLSLIFNLHHEANETTDEHRCTQCGPAATQKIHREDAKNAKLLKSLFFALFASSRLRGKGRVQSTTKTRRITKSFRSVEKFFPASKGFWG